MISTNQTYDRVKEEEKISEETPQANLISRVVSDFFQRAEQHRSEVEDAKAWGNLD